jgi:D-lactate dehydrogenase (cytochrome)
MSSAKNNIDLLERLRQIVGSRYVLEKSYDLAAYIDEPRGYFDSDADAVVLPGTAEQVATIVSACAKSGVSIVPQGGNTGLCGGAVSSPGQVILNLRRMNKIIGIDPINDTITVEAGCILSDIQQSALDADRYFPLSLGAEGSCQIGGNLSTNAGGINVLRYGNVRDQVLGLQAVLADGTIWHDLSELRKDNTGYDLRHLIIGSEGTLGIITQAVLRLFPRPKQVETCFVALRDIEASLELLTKARSDSSGSLSSFELIPGLGVDLAVRHISGCRNPLSDYCDWSVIMVYSGSATGQHLKDALEGTLTFAIDDGIATDAVISQSEEQSRQIWAIREGLREAQTIEGVAFSHDISVKVSKVPELIQRGSSAGAKLVPGVRPYPFGHVGDGNIHFSFLQPLDLASDLFEPRRLEFNKMIFVLVHELGGSFSAEHGVGLLRLEEMKQFKDPAGLGIMTKIKNALDPNGILNPGKVIPQ